MTKSPLTLHTIREEFEEAYWKNADKEYQCNLLYQLVESFIRQLLNEMELEKDPTDWTDMHYTYSDAAEELKEKKDEVLK